MSITRRNSMLNVKQLMFALFALSYSVLSFADVRLTHLSGQVQIKQSSGGVITATPEADISTGDAIVTGANGYVRVETSDGGVIVLRPNSEFNIEKYHFDTNKPEEDNFVFRILKGGMRTVTGLIGKRGNKNAYLGKAATATIGIRGTQFDVRVCQDDCGALANGTYFWLRSGAIQTGNSFGDITMSAGQFVFVGLNQAPVVLPRDPGVGFTPPNTIPKTEDKKEPAASNASSEAAPDANSVNCSIQ